MFSDAERAKDAKLDKMFLAMMTEHHMSAVRMSELAKGKSTRPELLRFTEKMVKDQTEEIQLMKAWEKAWFKKKETGLH